MLLVNMWQWSGILFEYSLWFHGSQFNTHYGMLRVKDFVNSGKVTIAEIMIETHIDPHALGPLHYDVLYLQNFFSKKLFCTSSIVRHNKLISIIE